MLQAGRPARDAGHMPHVQGEAAAPLFKTPHVGSLEKFACCSVTAVGKPQHMRWCDQRACDLREPLSFEDKAFEKEKREWRLPGFRQGLQVFTGSSS